MHSMNRSTAAFFFSIAALATTVPAQQQAHQLEQIWGDYRNVRGLDFIATFPGDNSPPQAQMPPQWQSLPKLRTLLGITGSSTPDFNDVASAVAMWECYDYSNQHVVAYVDAQLDRIWDAGFNTIRVWLSYQVYSFDPQKMNDRFQFFLGRCNYFGLHVIPVLWDADFFDPDTSSLAGANYANYTKWVRAPGNFTIQTQGGVPLDNERQFVIDMVTQAAPYSQGNNPVVLMWDAMNEPLFSVADRTQASWILETLSTIKSTNINAKTCVTPPYWQWTDPVHLQVARSADLDVVAFNFYGYGKRDIEGLCENVRGMFGDGAVKPILVAEGGRVGEGMHYPEAINLLSKVPASHTGNPNGEGVGFLLFSANIGEPWGAPVVSSTGTLLEVNFPAWEIGDGLFYAPRFDNLATTPNTIYVRDYVPAGSCSGLSTIQAMEQLAGNQGHNVLPHAYTYLPMPMTVNGQPNPDYIPQWKLPDGTNRCKLTEILADAMNGALGSGLGQQSAVLVDRELNVAGYMVVWSFWADYHYNFPTHPVSQGALLQIQADAQDVRNAMLDYPTNWWQQQAFLTKYQPLFATVHGYWANAYDVWYP